MKLPNLKSLKMKEFLLGIIFVFILVSPFIKVSIFSNEYIKVIFLLFIVGTTFYDLKLAILITVLFLILVINSPGKEKYTSNRFFTIGENQNNIVKLVDIAKAPPATCPGARNVDKDNINDNMFDLFFDPKIKPYENIISEITGCDKLLSAQNNLII